MLWDGGAGLLLARGLGGFANPGIRWEFCARSPLLGALGPVHPVFGVFPKHVPSPQSTKSPSSPPGRSRGRRRVPARSDPSRCCNPGEPFPR